MSITDFADTVAIVATIRAIHLMFVSSSRTLTGARAIGHTIKKTMATTAIVDDEVVSAAATPAATLPVFSLREVQLRKADSQNSLTFGVPAHASALLRLLHPKTHTYEEQDERWLHLLQAVAVVPSRKVETLEKLVQLALQLLPSPAWKRKLDASVHAQLLTLRDANEDFTKRALAALHLKDRVAQFLRAWLADPVDGVALWREHVVGASSLDLSVCAVFVADGRTTHAADATTSHTLAGLCLDDLVATPVGAGYLRGYRRADTACIVRYPWGHGFIQLAHVARLTDAIATERKKRKRNEFLVLEHQQLFEDVESLLDNYPPEQAADDASARADVTPEGVNVHEYEQLVASLRADDALDATVLQHDLSFVRRVQSLAAKTLGQHEQRQAAHESSNGSDAHATAELVEEDAGDGNEDEDEDDDVVSETKRTEPPQQQQLESTEDAAMQDDCSATEHPRTHT